MLTQAISPLVLIQCDSTFKITIDPVQGAVEYLLYLSVGSAMSPIGTYPHTGNPIEVTIGPFDLNASQYAVTLAVNMGNDLYQNPNSTAWFANNLGMEYRGLNYNKQVLTCDTVPAEPATPAAPTSPSKGNGNGGGKGKGNGGKA